MKCLMSCISTLPAIRLLTSAKRSTTVGHLCKFGDHINFVVGGWPHFLHTESSKHCYKLRSNDLKFSTFYLFSKSLQSHKLVHWIGDETISQLNLGAWQYTANEPKPVLDVHGFCPVLPPPYMLVHSRLYSVTLVSFSSCKLPFKIIKQKFDWILGPHFQKL